MDFQPWPKIPRLENEGIVITEKIDGTNAQIFIECSAYDALTKGIREDYIEPLVRIDGFVIYAGSRSKWVTPEDDNYGFATWVKANAGELVKLGTNNLGQGRYYGEWWGSGIQRGYGQTNKRFSLFNTYHNPCNIVEHVPVLYEGKLDMDKIQAVVQDLKTTGSVAAPGYLNPEGICIYFKSSKQHYKIPFNK